MPRVGGAEADGHRFQRGIGGVLLDVGGQALQRVGVTGIPEQRAVVGGRCRRADVRPRAIVGADLNLPAVVITAGIKLIAEAMTECE